jgi:hypothetical protein
MPYVKDSGNGDLNKYLSAMQVAVDFVDPVWEFASRMYQLWRGKAPTVLNTTFSKIMVNMAHSMVNDRIPKQIENLFASEDFVSLEALTPELELSRPGAEVWLRSMFKDESKLNIQNDILPTLQAANIMGTGFRMPCVQHGKDGEKWVPKIVVRDVDFFSILPMPDGGLINPIDRYSEDALSSFFLVDFMRREQIEVLEKYKGYNKAEATKLFESSPRFDSGLENKYRDIYSIIGGVTYNAKNDWRQRMQDIDGKTGRYRVVKWFMRDEYWIVAQDRFIIYKGPNPMGGGLLPLVTYKLTPDFKSFYGIGSLEMVEDMLYAIMMNFNYRMDDLARKFYPTKWIRKDIMGNKPASEFLDRPYAIHSFPANVQRISDAIYYDRAPEITQQTFMEEATLKSFVQEVSGFPNISKGMVGPGEKGGATGIVTAVRQAGARIDAECLVLEQGGLAQEGRLLLVLAHDNIVDDVMVPDPRSANGFGWTQVHADALTDDYVVHCKGTRYLSNKEQSFQKMLALYPYMNGNPLFDSFELNSQLLDAAEVFPDKDRILRKPVADQMNAMGMTAPMGATPGEPGGLAASQNVRNPARSIAGRNEVQPNTGALAPAGIAM